MDPLGVEDGRIEDSQITASTEWNANHRASYARLNQPGGPGMAGGWCPSGDHGEWLQVDLGVSRLVSGIVMQGRADLGHWVRTYMVQYNRDGSSYSSWHFVKERNQMYDAVSMFVKTFHATKMHESFRCHHTVRNAFK